MNKICITFIIALTIVLTGSRTVMAKEIQLSGVPANYGDEVEFIQTASSAHFTPDSKMLAIGGIIFGAAYYLCIGAAFIVLLVKGVQFMAAAPEGKAEIKKQMIAVVVGAFILFSIRGILVIISKLNLF